MDFLTFSSFSPSFFLALSAVPTSSAQPTFSRRDVCEWKFQKRLGAMICVQMSRTSSAFLAQASKPMMPLAGAAVKGHMFCHVLAQKVHTQNPYEHTMNIHTNSEHHQGHSLWTSATGCTGFHLWSQPSATLITVPTIHRRLQGKAGTNWDVRNHRKNWRFYRFSMSTGWPNWLPSESQGRCPSFDRHWWCESSGGATIRGTFAES